MKVFDYFNVLKDLATKLGDENLTVSMAYSNGGFFVSVSTHTSEQLQFDHGGYQRTVEVTEKDFNREKEELLKELVNIYDKLLFEKKEESDATNGD